MTTHNKPVDDKSVLVTDSVNNSMPNNEEKVVIRDPAPGHLDTENDYEGRKDEPDIDGPQQASQETDEIYADPRKEANLPAGGKNVGDLNAYNLSQEGNDI